MGLMVFYYLKGLINLIRLKKTGVILSSAIIGGLGVLGFIKINEFPEHKFFWIFLLSLLLILDTLLIGLHYSKKESKGILEKNSKLKSDLMLLIIAIILFLIGFSMKEIDFISIIILTGFMYAFLIGSYRIISKLKK